jgi:hypothetical protein
MKRPCLLIAFAFFAAPLAAEERVPEVVDLLKKAERYRPGTRDFTWREIPWYDEPAAALKQARDEKRPLFVWMAGGRDRDGSPLERC